MNWLIDAVEKPFEPVLGDGWLWELGTDFHHMVHGDQRAEAWKTEAGREILERFFPNCVGCGRLTPVDVPRSDRQRRVCVECEAAGVIDAEEG